MNDDSDFSTLSISERFYKWQQDHYMFIGYLSISLMITTFVTLVVTTCYFGMLPKYIKAPNGELSDETVNALLNMKGLRVDTCQLYAEILQMMYIKYYYGYTPSTVFTFAQRIYDVCIKKSN